ncbi:MAG: A/G-specific adenine glycosylase [Cardiobacteriales bacterium]|nr:MAG: A/G-specific adenine glycosylase [Cardiobacteriales bacterium]
MAISRPNAFALRLIIWQRQHGRHHLPWQNTNDPYWIWLSEVMLQQTQVTTVLDYFPRFIQALPTVSALADAPQDNVLSLWSGLGYYSRARNLQYAARQIIHHFAGKFPDTRAELETLKGIGRSTAAAIAVFAFGKREAILDGNVKRVLIRHRAINSYHSDPQTIRQLWSLAEDLLPDTADDLRHYTQGLMDLGSLICTRSQPKCHLCPIKDNCLALKFSLTHKLPLKKAKAVKPHKHTVMLIAWHHSYLLLEKRPDQGIWRNLWSFPEFLNIEAAQSFASSLGKLHDTYEHKAIKHSFTHYHLTIHPVVVNITPKANPHTWFTIEQALVKGLPKPTRQLIESLAK